MPSGLMTFSAPQGFSLVPPAGAGGSFSSTPLTRQAAAESQGSGLCPHWSRPEPRVSLTTASPRLPRSPQLASELSTHPLMAACHCVSPPPARPGMDQALSVPGAPLSFPVQSKSKPAPSVPFKTHLDAGLSPGTPISITIAIPVSQASSPPWMKPSFQPPLSPLSSSPSASPPCVATPVFPTETVLPLSLLEPPVTSHDSG